MAHNKGHISHNVVFYINKWKEAYRDNYSGVENENENDLHCVEWWTYAPLWPSQDLTS